MASKVSLLFQKIGSKEFRQQAFTYVKSKEFRGYFMRYFHYFIKYFQISLILKHYYFFSTVGR
jgi:hypothetical protein